MNSKKQAIMGVVGAAVLVVAVILIITNLPGRSEAGESSRLRVMIDSKTSEIFNDFRISEGQQPPYLNLKTGERTLFPAETCYWTRDGEAKLVPTMVLLRGWTEPGTETTCPDCGRKVVRHNPMPPTELLEAAARKKGLLPTK
jgi:hypothetical protein